MKTRQRVIQVVDSDGDLWKARVADLGGLEVALVRSEKFNPINSTSFMFHASPSGLRALGDLLERPTEPVPTRPRVYTSPTGTHYRVCDGRLEIGYSGRQSFYPAQTPESVYRGIVDLFDNPTEEVDA